MRRVALAIACLAAVVVAVAAGASGSTPTSQEWAARVTFPLYEPTVTLGFTPTRDGRFPCGYGGIETMSVGFEKGRAHIGFIEESCGNAGESMTVASADINGTKVPIDVFCYSPGPKCTVADGFKNGFLLYVTPPGPGRTSIEIVSSGISLDDLLTVVRSLARVTPTRLTVAGGAFRSPSGNLSCAMGGSLLFCQSKKSPHTVTMGVDGRFTRCDDRSCSHFGSRVSRWPTLGYSKRVNVGPFRCVSQTTGVTCTVIRSRKGFLINRDGVIRIGS